jgi:hypothetical protein
MCVVGASLSPAFAWTDELNHNPDLDNPTNGRGNFPRQAPPVTHSGTAGSVTQGNGINYHNGPVMRGGVNIYYIWYGNWAQDSTANAILTDFANNIGGSPYFNINTTYGDSVGNVPNSPATVKYVTSTSDAGSLGTSLSDGNIWTLVSSALTAGRLPVDPNGVYFVLTAPHVAETSGFLTQYCGWHTYNYYGAAGTPIKYAFVGNPAAALGACAAQSSGPNGDAAADGMVSVIAHELEESATDPQLNAWYDSNGEEVGDKCAWTFGTLFSAGGGAWANMRLGQRNYLIQQNWVNAGGGSCALSYSASSANFSLSASPATQTVLPGQATGNYAMTATPIGGWSGTVTYTVTGLPAGASPLISGNLIAIGTTASVAPGNCTFTITGVSGVLSHTTTATLVVSSPSFNIAISPASQSVTRPASGSVSANFTVTLTAPSSYSGTVNLTTTGAATGVGLTLTSTSVLGANKVITLKVVVTSSARKGISTLTVIARDASTTKSAAALLTIN